MRRCGKTIRSPSVETRESVDTKQEEKKLGERSLLIGVRSSAKATLTHVEHISIA